MNERILTQVNIIRTAVTELKENLKPKERVLVSGAIGDIETAVKTLAELIEAESPKA